MCSHYHAYLNEFEALSPLYFLNLNNFVLDKCLLRVVLVLHRLCFNRQAQEIIVQDFLFFINRFALNIFLVLDVGFVFFFFVVVVVLSCFFFNCISISCY